MTLEADVEKHLRDQAEMIAAGHRPGELVAACVVTIRCVCGKEREERIPIIKPAPVNGLSAGHMFWWGVKDCGCGRSWSFYVSSDPPPDLGFLYESSEMRTEGK